MLDNNLSETSTTSEKEAIVNDLPEIEKEAIVNDLPKIKNSFEELENPSENAPSFRSSVDGFSMFNSRTVFQARADSPTTVMVNTFPNLKVNSSPVISSESEFLAHINEPLDDSKENSKENNSFSPVIFNSGLSSQTHIQKQRVVAIKRVISVDSNIHNTPNNYSSFVPNSTSNKLSPITVSRSWDSLPSHSTPTTQINRSNSFHNSFDAKVPFSIGQNINSSFSPSAKRKELDNLSDNSDASSDEELNPRKKTNCSITTPTNPRK